MNRQLPQKPNLDYLKREARRILKRAKAGERQAFPDLDENATLLEVQHALAQDYGFSGWTELKRYVESQHPILRRVRPVLKITDYALAVEHYRDWLGFTLLWDWRKAPGQPSIAEFERDGFTFMVNEHPDTPGPANYHIDVTHLDALVEEWNQRRPGAVSVRISPPYEFPDAEVADPFGNVLVFEGKNDVVEARRRDEIRPKMRAYIEAALEQDRGFPTPEEVREAVGPPLGTAIEVLNEFAGYADAFAELSETREAISQAGDQPGADRDKET